MNTTQKRYTVAKVLEIAESKKIKVQSKKPNIVDHINRAAVDGVLKALSGKSLAALAREKVLSSAGRYSDSLKLSFEEIFVPPQEYLAAWKVHEVEKQKVKGANTRVDGLAEKIIIRINLDEFDAGQRAIALAMVIPQAKIG